MVFRNPDDPAQPYVKRVVGLPGEMIRLLGGDVYAGGQLQRKPLAAQQGVRIPVDDRAFQPDESDRTGGRGGFRRGRTRGGRMSPRTDRVSPGGRDRDGPRLDPVPELDY